MRAVLDPIGAETILAYARSLSEPWNIWTAVTLINGETIVGHCGGSPENLTDGELVLSHRDLNSELRLYVPVADIAQVRTLEVGQRIFGGEALATGPDADEVRSQLQKDYIARFPKDERRIRRAVRDRQSAELQRWMTDNWLNRPQLEISTESDSDALTSTDGPGTPSSISEDELSDVEFAMRARQLAELLRASAVRRALEHHYRMDRWPLAVAYLLEATVSFDGDFEPRPGARLYVDWDWISRHRNEINGLGLGFIVSASLDFRLSDAGAAEKMANKRPTPIGAVCRREKPTLVRGYVTFLEMPNSTLESATTSEGNAVSMDGGTWRAALVAGRPLAEPPTTDMPWVLTYWREGREEVGFEMLDRSVLPIDIFGSVHKIQPAQLRSGGTIFGETSCAMYVHYAAAASTRREWAKVDALFGRLSDDNP